MIVFSLKQVKMTLERLVLEGHGDWWKSRVGTGPHRVMLKGSPGRWTLLASSLMFHPSFSPLDLVSILSLSSLCLLFIFYLAQTF